MYSNLNYYQNNFENIEKDHSDLPNYISNNNHKDTKNYPGNNIQTKTSISDIKEKKISEKKSQKNESLENEFLKINNKNESLLPVLDPIFNLREISKQCILLEDHLSQKEKNCTDCIIKHFLTLEALSEEAITLDNENKHDIKNLPTEFRLLQKQWFNKQSSNHLISQQIRQIRKKIMIDSFPIIFSENAKGCSIDGKKCEIKNDL